MASQAWNDKMDRFKDLAWWDGYYSRALAFGVLDASRHTDYEVRRDQVRLDLERVRSELARMRP